MSKIQQAQARAALAAGRVRTFGYAPYLASYIYSLREHAVPGRGTIGVSMDGVLAWDPEFVSQLDVDQLAYTILHEALHLILRHHARAREVYGERPSPKQHLAMNVAGDLVIEQILEFMRPHRPQGAVYLGCKLPELGLTLDFPPNLELLDYYGKIMSAVPPEHGGNGPGGDSNGEPDQETDGEGGGSDATSPRPQSRSGKHGSRTTRNGASARACKPGTGGSAADGVQREHEPQDGTWGGYREKLLGKKLEDTVREHSALHPGSVPGTLCEALDHLLRPQPDPWKLLRSAVASNVASPLGGRIATYSRLSRKQPADLCRLRGLRSTQATAVVIVDTSGSMCDRETKLKALQVIADGLQKLKHVKVVCADTHIRNSIHLRDMDHFVWEGGGGTDMACAIEQVERDDRPDSIVLITDAATGWPGRQPRARVIVALTEDNCYRSEIPAWCKTVPLY